MYWKCVHHALQCQQAVDGKDRGHKDRMHTARKMRRDYVGGSAVPFRRHPEEQMKILIADDMPDVGKRLERLLRHMPGVSTVNYCSNTDDAILRLMELQPDLLILDHQLDRTDRGAVLRKLLHYSPHTEVCIYTELLADIDRSAFDRNNIHGFYEKSGDFDSLLAHVEDRASRLHENRTYEHVPIN